MDQAANERHGKEQQMNHLNVQVVTTSGTYPEEGFDSVPLSQPVHVELDKAKKQLEITDTSNWIVSASGNPVDPQKSYADNGLTAEAKLDWGPKEGGGGSGHNA
jgi:hypothetical protein